MLHRCNRRFGYYSKVGEGLSQTLVFPTVLILNEFPALFEGVEGRRLLPYMREEGRRGSASVR